MVLSLQIAGSFMIFVADANLDGVAIEAFTLTAYGERLTFEHD